MANKPQQQYGGHPKRYYAVAIGHGPQAPGIFDTWAKVHPLVTGFPGAKHQSFSTLSDAMAYMKANGVTNYQIVVNNVGDEEKSMATTKASASKGQKHYAVPEGRRPGTIHTSWDGPNGAKENTSGHPGAAHKRLNNEKSAQRFNDDYQQTRGQLVPTAPPRATNPRSALTPPLRNETYGNRNTTWFMDPFSESQTPIGYLSTSFSTSLNLRGNISGGLRLTRTDPDGTLWTREEVFNYNLETVGPYSGG